MTHTTTTRAIGFWVGLLVGLPRLWVVERTFSRLGRNRRLAKDYEDLADTLLAFVTLASIPLARNSLARW